jgi:hypothetical protein
MAEPLLGASSGRRPQPPHRASPTSAVDLHLVHWSSRPPGFFEGRASAEKAARRVDAKAAAVDDVKATGAALKRGLRELKVRAKNRRLDDCGACNRVTLIIDLILFQLKPND